MSTLPPREVSFLRELLASRPDARRAGPVALALVAEHGIGRVKGASVLYGVRDFLAAERLLQVRGYPIDAPALGGRRRDAAPGGSEKTGAAAVTQHLVAAVPLHMGVHLPPGSRFLAFDWRELDLASIDVLLECENLEPLFDLASYRWLEETFVRGRRTLAVFRGKPGTFGSAAAAQLMRESGKPVLGFYDFDPAGLGIAAARERLEALCLPPWEALEEAVRRYRRTHLFTDQVRVRQGQLEALEDGPVRTAWLRLKNLQCGLGQENFPR